MSNDNRGGQIFIGVMGLLVMAISIYVVLAFNQAPSKIVTIEEGITAEDWVKGNREAKVSLIEYGDFQCPACANSHDFLEELLPEFSDQLAFSFRHFPLKSIHPHAEMSARISEAAGKQGKFWEMVDLLYKNQDEWVNSADPEATLFGYAETLALDMTQFKTDFRSPEIRQAVEADSLSATKAGISSTPTFFLNGTKIDPSNLKDLRNLIQAEIDKQGDETESQGS